MATPADNIPLSSLEVPRSSSSQSTRSQSPVGSTPTTLQVGPPKHQRTTSPSDASLSTITAPPDVEGNRNASVLPPQDEGFGAWSYAVCAFTMFIVVWGFPEAFPIFQAHLSTRTEYAGSVVLPLLSPGMNDIIEGILFPFLPRRPNYRRPFVLSGIGLIAASLWLASCASTDWQIVLTQCIMFGVGGILLNFVHVSIFSEWFDKKKGQAMSFIWQGWRFGSLVFPLICQWLLESQGYEATLQWLLAPMIPLLLPAILIFRGRYAMAHVQTQPAEPPLSRIAALGAPRVLFHLLVVLLFSMVVNVPTMFLIPYGADLGLGPTDQVTAYCLRSLSAMIGIYAFGRYSDGDSHDIFMAASPLLSSLVYIVLWGFAKSKMALYLYAIVIGLTSGGYDNILYGMYSEIAGNNGALFTAVHGIFSLVRGISVLSIGPIGTAIVRHTPDVVEDEYALGKYKFLILYVSIMSMASGLIMTGHILKGYYGRQ